MKTLSISLLILFLCSFIAPETTNSQKTTVSICTGKYSKRYHTSPPSNRCKGMKSCKGEKKEVTISEAKKMGLTPCGYCFQ